jgi:N-acetylglucosamine-6-phosphate deacetylase
MLIPGFVDLQVNGYLGTDFSSPELTAESFRIACLKLLAHGTAVFLPTMVTSPEETYRRNLSLMAQVMDESEFAGRLPGFHIEGPFISAEPGAVGAHNPAWVVAPDIGLLDRMIEWSGNRIRMLTVAAEIPGMDRLIRHAQGRGITVALGHHLAVGEDLSRAADAGAKALTHLGNGVPNILPRHPNPIWAGLADDRLQMMVIADGHHLPAGVIKAMLRAKGIEKSIVVSDASSLAGMPPGRYETLGNLAVLEPDGLLHNPEKGCLVGSSYTMLECMNFLARQGWYDLDILDRLGARNALELIGLDPSGRRAGPGMEYVEGKGFMPA